MSEPFARFTLGVSATLTWGEPQPSPELATLVSNARSHAWSPAELDWSRAVDPREPAAANAVLARVLEYPVQDDAALVGQVLFHTNLHLLSQTLHGEQGALLGAAALVAALPDLEAKTFAATQVNDEARHVEALGRYLSEVCGARYAPAPGLKTLFGQVFPSSRWELLLLAVQLMIEPLALAGFKWLRVSNSRDPLFADLLQRIYRDEARHVAFGLRLLKPVYADLDEATRREHQQFAIEVARQLSAAFAFDEVRKNLSLGPEWATWAACSRGATTLKRLLFSKIVGTLQKVGLYSATVQAAFEQLGVLGPFAQLVELDPEPASGIDVLPDALRSQREEVLAQALEQARERRAQKGQR
ncbi:MAG: ferritin-like domain-containing protein [Archangiaceae bacterium]|nr:ferritin-like domain-containing protein [Archangiaceae bacterium]